MLYQSLLMKELWSSCVACHRQEHLGWSSLKKHVVNCVSPARARCWLWWKVPNLSACTETAPESRARNVISFGAFQEEPDLRGRERAVTWKDHRGVPNFSQKWISCHFKGLTVLLQIMKSGNRTWITTCSWLGASVTNLCLLGEWSRTGWTPAEYFSNDNRVENLLYFISQLA